METCPKCGKPNGFRTVHMFGRDVEIKQWCECVQNDWLKEASELEKVKEETRIRQLQSGVGAEYREYTFETATNNTYTRIAKRYCEKWQDMHSDNIGLILCGSPGTGKTFIAGCIANRLLHEHVPVLMDNFPKIISRLQTFGDSVNDFCREMDCYELVIIDDLGVERNTEFAKEMIYTIIDHRYTSGKPMIITTNISKQELLNPTSMELMRIYDRILQNSIPIEVKGENRRKKAAEDKLIKARNALL